MSAASARAIRARCSSGGPSGSNIRSIDTPLPRGELDPGDRPRRIVADHPPMRSRQRFDPLLSLAAVRLVETRQGHTLVKTRLQHGKEQVVLTAESRAYTAPLE
jgi:hypothetical protein